MSKEVDRFTDFMNGLVAAAQLQQRAGNNGFMIEFIVLTASIIDGGLRVGLVLQHQIDTKSTEVPEHFIYQADEDKALSERQIYRHALEAKIISQSLFDELQELYSARNRVIHRYIISAITTEKVFKIAHRYEMVIQKVNSAIWVIEDRQTQLGVGMTRKSKKGEHKSEYDAMARLKHGADWLAHALKRNAP